MIVVEDGQKPPNGLGINVNIEGGWPPGLKEWLQESARKRAILDAMPIEQVREQAIIDLDYAAAQLRQTPLTPELARHGWSKRFADGLADGCENLSRCLVDGSYEKAWGGGGLGRWMLDEVSGLQKDQDELHDAVSNAEFTLEAYSERLPGPVGRATVAFWHAADGWGGISDPDREGIGFVHFMIVEMEGFRELTPGQTVEYEWADDGAQDGCLWRAKWLRPLKR